MSVSLEVKEELTQQYNEFKQNKEVLYARWKKGIAGPITGSYYEGNGVMLKVIPFLEKHADELNTWLQGGENKLPLDEFLFKRKLNMVNEVIGMGIKSLDNMDEHILQHEKALRTKRNFYILLSWWVFVILFIWCIMDYMG